MRFKDTKLSAPEIARMLGVDAMVEGSVIRDGGRIRVNAQLIRGATDDHFWSEAYDREMRDTLELESDVAQSIARRVEVTVSEEERARVPQLAMSRLKFTRAISKVKTNWGIALADLGSKRAFNTLRTRSTGTPRLPRPTSAWHRPTKDLGQVSSALLLMKAARR